MKRLVLTARSSRRFRCPLRAFLLGTELICSPDHESGERSSGSPRQPLPRLLLRRLWPMAGS